MTAGRGRREVLGVGADPIQGGGVASALNGATSIVHLALIALLLLALPPPFALYGAMWLGVLAYALGLVRLCQVGRVPPLAAPLVVLAGLLIGQGPYQLTNGLETGLAMAAVVWALALALEDTARRSRLLAGLCGTLPFVRPELGLLGLLLLVVSALRHRRLAAGDGTALKPSLIPI